MIVKVKIGEKTYQVEIEDLNKRPVVARIEGQSFEVWPEVETHPVLPVIIQERMPDTGLQTNQKDKSILSPLPGTVTEVNVETGSKITTGEALLIIEAMKMKNAIRAASNGVVKAVHVSPGQTVQHKQLLVELE